MVKSRKVRSMENSSMSTVYQHLARLRDIKKLLPYIHTEAVWDIQYDFQAIAQWQRKILENSKCIKRLKNRKSNKDGSQKAWLGDLGVFP